MPVGATWYRRRSRSPIVLSIVICVVAAAAVVLYASRSSGNPARHVDLNDGGVWVTNNEKALFGQFNKPAEQLQGGFFAPGGAQSSASLDILQSGSTIIAWDRGKGLLYPVDAQLGRAAADSIAIPSSYQVALGGDTAAVLDPATGRLWAAVVTGNGSTPDLATLDPNGKPLTTVGRQAALTISQDGTVFAVSADKDKVATVRPNGGHLASPETAALSHPVRQLQLTAVGSDLVVLDVPGRQVFRQGGPAVKVQTSADAALGYRIVVQQPGPESDDVAVSTSDGLQSVPLGGGKPTLLYNDSAGLGSPAAPVFLDGCVNGAWGGSPAGRYARSCDGKAAQAASFPTSKEHLSTTEPVFRVNWDQIVVNDLDSGAIFVLAPALAEVSNWAALVPKVVHEDKDKNKDTNDTANQTNQAPKAAADRLGARAGRVNVLHVLDNDSNPSGGQVAINSISASSVGDATLTISPDGQTLLMDIPDGAAVATRSFSYTIDDGRGKTSNAATVTVTQRADAKQNTDPALRKGAKKAVGTTTAGATFEYPVLTDWRDPDSDPLVLTGASVPGGTVSTTADGRLIVTTASSGDSVVVEFQMTDGYGGTAHGTLTVKLQDPRDGQATNPVAEPDVVRGSVGTALHIEPLANDLPGSDPTNPQATLVLNGDASVNSGNAHVVTDQTNGFLSFTAQQPGTYLITYKESFGSSQSVPGTVRVDIDASKKSGIIATPDVGVLHGQQAAIVDVLANDFDLSGGAMVVTQAAETTGDGDVQVSIIDSRWLRIAATTPELGGTRAVHYSVSDGADGRTTGEVDLTQLPPPEKDSAPIPQDDAAKVRSADSVTVPVLDNDTDPDGDTLNLTRAKLTVTPELGTAEVAGNQVRYIAPEKVTTPTTVTIDYVVADPSAAAATGHLVVTVEPPPNNDNAAPVPKLVTQGVVAGDTANIAVPVTGVDPDGDSVTVIGIASPPQLGRIRGISANSISYQAYPNLSGTDSFTYQVQDRYGAIGTATVRIGVVAPGAPQPPVAVDDVLTAAPGADVSVMVLSNDFVTPGDSVSVSLPKVNGVLPGGTKLDPDGRLHLTAPRDRSTANIVYDLTDGTGEPSRGHVIVRTLEGYNNPPETRDDTAKLPPTGDSATVDVLANDDDPDGPAGDLTLVSVSGGEPGTRVQDGKVVVALGDYPQTVAYVVSDGDAETPGSAIGIIHVPAKGTLRPALKPNVGEVTLRKGESRDIDINDYVTDPSGKGLRLTTTDRIWASPDSGLRVSAKNGTTLHLTAIDPYIGPAAATFEVTDDPGGDAQGGVVINLPVQIGPVAPVIRCPDTVLQLVEGGSPLSLNIVTVCHVWSDSDADLDDVTFTAKWSKQAGGVDLAQSGQGNRVIGVTATSSARPGSSGTIKVSAANAKSATLRVKVIAAPAASMSPISMDGLYAGKTTVVDVAPYMHSRMADPQIQVLSADQEGATAAKVSLSGSKLSITPAADFHGTLRYDLEVTDVAGHKDRTVPGLLTLGVRGHPDTPGNPRATANRSQTAVVSFTSPAPNGSPIIRFDVEDNTSRVHTCAASPCTVTGLSNGTSYRFRVRAVNAVGKSDPSGWSNVVVPDVIPEAPRAVVATPGDTQAVVTWQPPAPNGGTAVQKYYVQISPNPGSGSSRQTVGAGVRQARFVGLANGTSYSFRVSAVNGKGPGAWSAAALANPFGAPDAPTTPAVSTAQSADQSSEVLRVAWNAPNGNGRTVISYTVRTFRSGALADTAVVNSPAYQRQVANDGAEYRFDVSATNAGKKTSPYSPRSAPITASGVPAAMAAPRATATGQNGQATLNYAMPNNHGAPITRYYYSANGGGWTPISGNTISGLNNGTTYTFRMYAENNRGGGPPSGASNAIKVYGPMNDPKAIASQVGAHSPSVHFEWDPNVATNGRALKSCVIDIDGKRATTSCSAGSTDRNEGYSKPGTIKVTVTDTAGQTASKSDSATSGTPVPPDPKVHLEEGAQETCSDGSQNCHVVIVIVDDFTPNKQYPVHFQGRVSPWDSGGRNFTDSTDGNGHFRHVTQQWYANRGTIIDVTIDGKKYACNWP
ncbi:MAG: Ig-like domain-containing protein [Jatrophihabitans sp.]